MIFLPSYPTEADRGMTVGVRGMTLLIYSETMLACLITLSLKRNRKNSPSQCRESVTFTAGWMSMRNAEMG